MDSTKKIAVELIGKYLGSSMANMYSNFYSNQDDSVVKVSVRELLSEYLGKETADSVLHVNGLDLNQ